MPIKSPRQHAPSDTLPPLPPPPASPPPAPTPTIDAERERLRRAAEQAEREARAADEMLIPAALSQIVAEPGVFGALGIQKYMANFVAAAASSTDPVEQILLSQLLIAHHRAAQLQAEASEAKQIETIKVLNAAAVRLVAEIRRLALAIRQYRTPVNTKQFTVVGQQNIATGAEQRVTYVNNASHQQDEPSFSSTTELIDKANLGEPNESKLNELREERESRSRRQDQRLQAETVDGGGEK